MPIISHKGTTNPLFEGWISSSLFLNKGITVGPVTENGVKAWMVNDSSEEALFVYAALPIDAQLRAANNNGWKLSTIINVTNRPDPDQDARRTIGGDASPFILFRDGRLTYQMHFQTAANGDLYLYLMTDASFENRKGIAIRVRDGAQRYLSFDLIYDPDRRATNLLINGKLAYTGYSGARFRSIPMVMWGSGTTVAKGQANFSSVSFSILNGPR